MAEKQTGVSRSTEDHILAFYQSLFHAWGRQHWWPAQSRFEVIVGAYLTQNTAWTNVELALKELRHARVLNVAGIRRTSIADLEKMIRSAGYFRQKARSLKNLVEFVDASYGGSLTRMFAQPTERLREELLSLRGVGPETADSILLYAGNHPVFVVDTYTRRLLDRHGILPLKAKYEEVRQLFERALSRGGPVKASARAGLDRNPLENKPQPHAPSRMSRGKRDAAAQMYNEMHGLIVQVGKRYCLKSKALCEECPLGKFLPNKKK
jgi:endonuclease-3 related protein